ncbi:MAG: DUF370 domain-containing protein [Clostridia bacterium]|nr:DUF370 domain-containing protein [Clostridia bacterium]MBQ8334090.1 DUF370 domain-containing protein [Clostridia bacterium]MBQ8369939.1 DUF370 domain-containing protein [Clostridia bacterium]MBQ8513325.1 DUF370 domain-containing protein [Clostridia bacterium]
MPMKFVNVGFNNMINAERVVAVIASESAPAKRLVQDARDSGRAIDCTCGRKTRCIVIMDSDHVILSAIQNETISQRLAGGAVESEEENEQ